ncbi:MAG: hypothetical protein D6820_00875 [Lentisphaerae bacterium]|nr:MAG: hypothetical protein D6820_00875 [Lentisphaerota bacterium]
MKVRRYTGSSLEKIQETISKDFGEHAVIVNTRKIAKPGFLPGSSSTMYEVIAAIDEAMDADRPGLHGESVSPDIVQELLETSRMEYRGLRESILRLDEKLVEIDNRLNKLNKVSTVSTHEHPWLENIHPAWRERLAEEASRLAANGIVQYDDWVDALAGMIPTASGILFRSTAGSSPDVYAFIGPTGVGKTTTLAKLASQCVFTHNLNVGLLTIDTFRVAAVDQLREYANLLGVELQVAFSAEELSAHIESFQDKDVILIDTPGRSQFDKLGLKGIEDCISPQSDLSVILVVPAGIRREDANAVYQSYRSLSPDVLILSKLDEATRCDGLTSLIDISHLPIVYLTTGQRVPEDIEPAHPQRVAQLILSKQLTDSERKARS